MQRFRYLVLLLLILLLLMSPEMVTAQGIVLGPDGEPVKQSFRLPYAFYNEKFGAAVGFALGMAGYPQPQSTMLVTAMDGSGGSGMIFLIGNNIQVPFFRRLFLDPIASVGYFSDTYSYVNGKPIYSGQQAGDNDSKDTSGFSGFSWCRLWR